MVRTLQPSVEEASNIILASTISMIFAGQPPSVSVSLSVSLSLGLSHLSSFPLFPHRRGHITIASSHYLSTTLSSRILGGYFLGCELTPIFKEAYLDLLALADDPLASSSFDFLSLSSIVKVGCPSASFTHLSSGRFDCDGWRSDSRLSSRRN
jgi:hypothetical protein